MRIALINAQSLPTFTGGASIQAHRLAKELLGRGHQVRILSGADDPRRKPLAARTEMYDGLEVTTVSTEPFLAFDRRENYDNPAAAAVVVKWLRAFSPDVVHAHSLHGLGATWIDEATRTSPVVVTMHDWWWVCARQFLVTPELHVDGPLIDYATCPCAGGTRFNAARRAWLEERLRKVDMVLVPSQLAKDSLVINGLDPGRIEVNRNGVVRQPGSVAPVPGAPPHLGFVGGGHDFKGLSTLIEAIGQLGATPPLRLTCWGADAALASAHPPPGVTFLPPFAEGESGKVMVSLDALAVPSLMRESFSLVTHEALAAGVPVICSDCLGPEEVVRHGVNGLLVETDSPTAWANALRRWGSDAELRAALRLGAQQTQGPVDLAAQARELEGFLQRALESHPEPAREAASAPPVEVPPLLILCGIEGAPLRYRAFNLAQAHRLLGGRAECLHYGDPDALERMPKNGLVIFYRVPWSGWVSRCVEAARSAGNAVVFSVDDLVFDPSLRKRIPALKMLPRWEAELWMDGVRRYQAAAKACGLFLGSTPTLIAAAKAQGLRPFMYANGLGAEVAHLSQVALRETRAARAHRRLEGTCRVAYLSGSTTHDLDWRIVEPAVARLLERHPKVELWVLGPLRLGGEIAENHPRLHRVGFRPFQDLPRLACEADVVLAPLEPGLEFSEAKSAVKWIEAAALGLPVVATPTGPFREVIEHGVSGLLAEEGEWEAAIESLIVDPDLRDRLGRQARKRVYSRFGPWAQARAWAETWPQLIRASREPIWRLPDQDPVEPPTPGALEPEAPVAYLDNPPLPRETVRNRLGGDRTVGCRFTPVYSNLCRVDVYTTFSKLDQPKTELMMEIQTIDGTPARRTIIPPERLADDGWLRWEFKPLTDSAGRNFRLLLRQPRSRRDEGVSCWSALDAGFREVDGRELAGGICMRAFGRPSREEITAVAAADRTPVPTRRRGGLQREARLRYHRGRILYHKGRVTLRTEGVPFTTAKVMRYFQRTWFGFLSR